MANRTLCGSILTRKSGSNFKHPKHPLLPEAYLLRGDSLKARRSYYKALFEYEFVAVSFTGSEAFVRALEREFEIAQLFAAGTKRKLWGMRIVDASNEAEELLIRIQERLPGSRLAEDAGMALGDFYFSRRKMDLAAEMYSLFIQNFPRSRRIAKARKRLIYAYLASFKGAQIRDGLVSVRGDSGHRGAQVGPRPQPHAVHAKQHGRGADRPGTTRSR